MLVYHQAIHCPRLTSHLICPMQSPVSGVRINELPKFLAEDLDENMHAIIVNDPLNPNKLLITLLALKGVTSYLPYGKPKASKYEDELIPHIGMTSKLTVWEISETGFSEHRYAITDFRGEVISSETIKRG